MSIVDIVNFQSYTHMGLGISMILSQLYISNSYHTLRDNEDTRLSPLFQSLYF